VATGREDHAARPERALEPCHLVDVQDDVVPVGDQADLGGCLEIALQRQQARLADRALARERRVARLEVGQVEPVEEIDEGPAVEVLKETQ
jgi:hypothetical protein